MKRRALIAGVGVAGLLAAMAGGSSLRPAAEEAEDAPTRASSSVVTPAAPNGVALSRASRAERRPALDQPAWSADQVVVSAAPALLETIARDHGSAVLRPVGTAGYGALAVPPGQSAAGFLAALGRDARIHGAAPQGLTYGASAPSDLTGLQWHLDAGDFNEARSVDVSGVTVAVLDTGVAYENWSDGSGSYVAAPSLSGLSIVAPWDFVNDDAHANDDHQHGTHIASIIASEGAVQGTAPGVRLMPLKVLDAGNSGVELDLVNAIHHAVDNGADIINLSLTFGPAYVPSPLLQDALVYAAEHEVVMVAAAGNAALDAVGWPAASPLVVAVAAGCLGPDDDEDLWIADYSNRGLRVDLVAAGGCVDRDTDEDGRVDGVLAESIDPGDPTRVGYWLMAGTSQAAAMVTGAAAQLLADGAAPKDVRLYLQDEADRQTLNPDEKPFLDGQGAGVIDIEDALEKREDSPSKFKDDVFYAAVLPYLIDRGDGTVQPAAQITVLEHDLDAAEGVTVWGRFRGSSDSDFSCWLDDDDDDGGVCTVLGPAVSAADGDVSWSVTVDFVQDSDRSHRPGTVVFPSGDLAEVSAAMLADPSLKHAALGIGWAKGTHERLGKLAAAQAVVNAGRSPAAGPMGVLASDTAIGHWGGTLSNLDGSGISTSPFGHRIIDFDGTGISTSPFGLRIKELGGSGISTSPFGFRVIALKGSGISTSPFGVLGHGDDQDNDDDDDDDFGPIVMGPRLDLGDDADGLQGTAIGAIVASGGWSIGPNLDGASLLVGVSLGPDHCEPIDTGAGVGAVELSF